MPTKLTFIPLILTVALFSSNSYGQATADSLINFESDYEYIPGEADFDLIKDRLSCIEKTIPLHYNTRVHAFVNYFTVKDREYTKNILKIKDKYFPLFEKYLAKYDLPEELKYLSIIESGLNPVARSRVSAVGLWQFMSATGRYFGLHNDWYIDERMDPEKSTEAACKYLKQLYGMFGDWELAIAAYNTGPGNIRKAIRRSGYKKTFWEIYPHLYRETRSYLPQFTAIIYAIEYADEHNLMVEDIEVPIAIDTIIANGFVHLKTMAGQLNLCEQELKALNPSLKRGVLPEKVMNYPIYLPAHAKADFSQRRTFILDTASKIGKKEMEYLARNSVGSTYGRDKVTYRVKSGDVLGKIAQRYNVRIADLRSWNLINGNLIKVGQRLNIWLKDGVKPKPRPTVIAKLPDGSKTYLVQPGDTLWDISRKFDGLSIEKIKKLNALNSNVIKPGQRLIIGS